MSFTESTSSLAGISADPRGGEFRRVFPVRAYDLAGTLSSGQAFRWKQSAEGWEGVIKGRWVFLTTDGHAVCAEVAEATHDWQWLSSYLQVDLDLEGVLNSFPQDEPMREAVRACRGLRLLRQDPWECLASFILSSTKQIVQIQQIVALLCERFGERIRVPPGRTAAFAFPTAAQVAAIPEADLRECKMGFRAPYLKGSAEKILAGEVDLSGLGALNVDTARQELLKLPGVGNKIADCVLLFAYGFPQAFPVDVWVAKALRTLYFPKRRVHPKRLHAFSRTHFGPHAGYAQQYLFHYMRTRFKPASAVGRASGAK